MIFAREINDNLTSLVKQIDAETVKNSKKNMGSFVVFLSDDEKMVDKAKALADKAGLKECILTAWVPARCRAAGKPHPKAIATRPAEPAPTPPQRRRPCC